MSATLYWGDRSVSFFPWDTPESVVWRIREQVPHAVVRDDLAVALAGVPWGDGEEDLSVRIRVDDLAEGWDSPDMITTMRGMDAPTRTLYARYKTEKGEIDETLWDTLFRHEFQDMSFDEWQEEARKSADQEKQDQARAREATEIYQELLGEDRPDIVGWKSERHLVRHTLEDPRPPPLLFSQIDLGNVWRLAVLSQVFFEWGEKQSWVAKMRRLKDPSVEGLLGQVHDDLSEGTGIVLYRQGSDVPVRVRPNGAGAYEVELQHGDDQPGLADEAWRALGVSGSKKEQDVGTVGSFIFTQMSVDVPLFLDMCMNDPVISHFLQVNEAGRMPATMTVNASLRPTVRGVLGVADQARHDLSIRTSHRQSGFQVQVVLHSAIPGDRLPLFFLLMRQLLGRYNRRKEQVLREYERFIPTFRATLEKTRNALVKSVRATRPEYIAKYPRMFVRNLYSVMCQKNLQPTLIGEEDTHGLPDGSYIRFPPRPIAEIEPEYYYCPNKDYPYAGLKEMDLKGREVFINMAPCCFNSPQEKENERKLARLRTKDDVEEEEGDEKSGKTASNIISGKLLIKNPGQLGTVRPPDMNRLFMAYDPFADYYRVGTTQSPSSLIDCLLTRRRMMGASTPNDAAEVRAQIAADQECVTACLQENPGLTTDEIRSDMSDPNVYFDPRRFYRAVELYFGVQLIVFSKERGTTGDEARIMRPSSMRSHYTNHPQAPIVFVFEHWGGKTNILSRYNHPHCELIGYKPFTETSMRSDFSPKGLMELLPDTDVPFDGDRRIQPFYRKECWFFRHVVGQTTDPLGKVRWLHFQYYGHSFHAELSPPIAVQDDLGVGPLPAEPTIVAAPTLLRFLGKFDHWERIDVPDPQGDVVYWTVAQDNALWRSAEDHSPLRLTFACRLPQPRPEEIGSRTGDLLRYIRTDPPLTTLHRNPTPALGHAERVASLLSQLCVYAFSHYSESVGTGSVDTDEVLNTFFRQHILVRSGHAYPDPTTDATYDGFIDGERIILPSRKFWDRVAYQLRWLSFYYPKRAPDPPNTLRKVGDFTSADPRHYYCALEHLGGVLRHSIEDMYEVAECMLEELPDECKRRRDTYVIWRVGGKPKLVVSYPDKAASDEAARAWRERHIITDPSAPVVDGNGPVDVPAWDDAAVGRGDVSQATVGNIHLLFFPME